jgi:transposase InsO family protein
MNGIGTSRRPVSGQTLSSVNASRRSSTSREAPTVGRGCIGRCVTRVCASDASGWVKTTLSDPDVVAVDLLKRRFGPDTVELDRVYFGDLTYLRTWEGWLYLATVIDLASRRVVGWAMADHMRAELVCDALHMAIENRRPARARFSIPTVAPNTPRPSSPTCSRSTR